MSKTVCPEKTCQKKRFDGKTCFVCECGRHQTYAAKNEGGGVTEIEVRSIGWVPISLDNWEWQCPFCSGNEWMLDAVFEQGE